MSADRLPVMRVELPFWAELEHLVTSIQSAGVYSNFGPQVRAYEAEFAALVGCKPDCVVSAVNATLGIQGALSVMDLPQWILQGWTFAATAHAAKSATSRLVFGDVESTTWLLDPKNVWKGAGALLTAPFGSPIRIDDRWNHAGGIVIDAAASVGSPPEVDSSFSGNWAIVYSLHATKILGIGEGGMVVFSDSDLASRFRDWTNFGFSGARIAQGPGTNAKMPELLAAVGRVRLSHADEEFEEWRYVRRFAHATGETHDINPFFSIESLVSPYWITEFKTEWEKRRVEEALWSENIETRNWWSDGCHRMPAFRGVDSVSPLVVSDDVASRTLGLPFFRGMTPKMVERISQVIGAALR